MQGLQVPCLCGFRVAGCHAVKQSYGCFRVWAGGVVDEKLTYTIFYMQAEHKIDNLFQQILDRMLRTKPKDHMQFIIDCLTFDSIEDADQVRLHGPAWRLPGCLCHHLGHGTHRHMHVAHV